MRASRRRRRLEHIDERVADCASLCLRLLHARQCGEELAAGIHGDERHPQVLSHRLLHLGALVETQQAGVHEHAGELVADGAMHERGRDGAVHSARKSADDLRLSHLPANLGDLVLDEGAWRPRRFGAADLEQEVGKQLRAARGMRHLRVKLHAVDRLRLMLERGHRVARARGGDAEPGWRLLDVVAVTHPHGRRIDGREAAKERALDRGVNLVATILALCTALHLSAVQLRNELHAVAHSQHGCHLEHRAIGRGRVLAVHRVGAAAEDDARRRPFANPLERSRGRMNLGVHARLAHAPRNELGVLRAVVDDQDAARVRHRVQIAGSRLRSSTRFESRSRMAPLGVPYTHPQDSPGFTMSVSPRVFISC